LRRKKRRRKEKEMRKKVISEKPSILCGKKSLEKRVISKFEMFSEISNGSSKRSLLFSF
jgi:hypothetical protein